MRVLQVHCRYRQPGGEDAVVEREARLLRAAGHDVETVIVDNPEGALKTASALLAAPWNSRSARRVRDHAITGLRPDVVHVHNTWFALSPAVLPAVHGAGLPIVMTVHNHRLLCVNAELFRDGANCHDCVGRSPVPGVLHRCYRGSVAASTAVAVTMEVARRRRVYERDVSALVTPSRAVRDLLIAGGMSGDHLHVVPNPVPDPGGRAALPSSSRTVLFAGRLIAAKGFDVLLSAWRAQRPPGLVLEVAGEGPLSLLAENEPGVRLLGRIPPADLARRMLAARAVVVPSVWDEPFGLVAVEAMAAGAPVLASRSGALPELLAQADNAAWLVGVDGWAPALERLVPGPVADGELDRAGQRGRRAYEVTWTSEMGVRRLVEVYEHVVRER